MSEVEWAVLGYDKKDKSEFIDRTPESREEAESQIARFYSRPSQYRDVRVVSRTVGEWGTPSSGVTEGKAESGGPLLDYLEAALGIICNAHRARVDDVTEADGASPGWGEAARKWIDAYPPYKLMPEPAWTPTSDPETLARRFHEAYERLAPSFGYETREASAKPWAQVPENNRRLMIAVCREIAAQPPAPADDAATVLAGLRAELVTIAQENAWARRQDQADGVRLAIQRVEAAQRRLADRGQAGGSHG